MFKKYLIHYPKIYILIAAKKQIQIRMREKEQQRLVWPEHHDVYESDIKKKIRKFMMAYSLLHEFLTMGEDPEGRESMQFYSNLYVDMVPLLTEITCYVINNGYMNKRERVDNAIFLSQKILGCLKMIHHRYLVSITSVLPIEDNRWYQYTEKSNQEIIDEIADYFDKIFSFKFEE